MEHARIIRRSTAKVLHCVLYAQKSGAKVSPKDLDYIQLQQDETYTLEVTNQSFHRGARATLFIGGFHQGSKRIESLATAVFDISPRSMLPYKAVKHDTPGVSFLHNRYDPSHYEIRVEVNYDIIDEDYQLTMDLTSIYPTIMDIRDGEDVDMEEFVKAIREAKPKKITNDFHMESEKKRFFYWIE